MDLDIQTHRIARRLLAPATALRHVAVALQILQIANADGTAIILSLLLLLRLLLDIDRLRLQTRENVGNVAGSLHLRPLALLAHADAVIIEITATHVEIRAVGEIVVTGAIHGWRRLGRHRGRRTLSKRGCRLRIHHITHESRESGTRLRHGINSSVLERTHQVRILTQNVVHAGHRTLEHRVRHMHHHRAASELEQELELWRHGSLGLVLVVKLTENLVIIGDILIDLVTPSIEFNVERVEPAVQELNSIDGSHQHIALKLDGILA